MMTQQRQVQTMAPQMRQSLEILQLPIMELRALIQREMVTNPVIEDVTSAQELVADTTSESPAELETMAKSALDDTHLPRNDLFQGGQSAYDPSNPVPDEPKPGKGGGEAELDFDTDTLRTLGNSDRDYFFEDEQTTQPFTKEAEDRRRYMFDSIAQPPVSLQQYLLDQLVAADLSVEETQIGEMIIGGLDDAGFLANSVEDLAEQTAFPVEQIEHVLHIVQTFDPPGIAARNVRECLLAQIVNIDVPGADIAEAIISGHLEAFAQKKYGRIAEALGCTEAEVEEAGNLIRRLTPRPASIMEGRPADYISPEIFVDRDENGHWRVRIDDDQLPRIHLNQDYRNMLDRSDVGSEAKSYIRERLRAGKSLIASIEQRQKTIYQIATVIVEAQQEFLERGVTHLKPMTMVEVAAKVNRSETTVSRTVANKYMKTPRGVFELRYFFSTGVKTESGDTIANKTIQNRIADIVRDENPASPLSDQAIVDILAKEGIKLARRTVDKYRKIMHIPPSHKRRRG